MKPYLEQKITFLQFVFIPFGIQVGVAILSLPRILAQTAGTDGWISILICWLLNIAASLIIVQVMSKGPEGTVLDMVSGYMGAWAGKALALLFFLYFLFLTYDGLGKTVLLTKIWLLPKTSTYTLIILLLIPTYIIARHGPQIIARYVELVVLVSFWVPIIYLMPLKEAHWLHLFPIIKNGWAPIFQGVHSMIYPSLGMISTFVLYPYLKQKEKASAGVILSSSFTMLIYLFMTIVCFVYYSPDEITDYNDPVISVLKSIEFHFIERVEVTFIAFYLLVFSLVWIPCIYLTTFFSSWMLGKQDNRNHLRYLCILIAISSFFFSPSFNQNSKMQVWLTRIGFYMEYILPLCLLIYLMIYIQVKRRSLS